MFRENKFVKFIACTIVACFSYSFVLFEPLYGAVQEYRDGALARAMSSKMERFVLPYRYGRVMGGSYSGGERLVVFVQDLHCHPEVQRNISEIENLLDKRYGLEKIFVEGAPMGRVDTKVLDTMPARIKDKVLESLLDQGLLSGSEYYAVKNKQDKLYGLEEWGTYLGNYNRIKRLIESRDGRVKAAQDVAARIEAIKREHLSPELRKLERYIKKAEAPGADKSALAKTGKKSEEHYFELEKLGAKVNEDVSQYPNLKKFIDMARFGREINYKKLPTQMQEYVEELKKVVPFGVYRQLTKKLEEGNREEEYYFAMSEIAAQYAPLLNTRYPEVNKFLAYIRLNYSINPIYLVNEEKGFGERILDKTAKRLVDKELIFLSRMSEAFAGMADLKVTPEEYGYFKENVGRYRALLQKYISRDELSDAMAVMGDEDLYKYFEVNIGRNDIFSSVIIDKEQGSGGAAATLGYEAVLSNINKFSKIDVVVTGGFHSEVVKALDKAGISYVAVTPNATKMFDEGVYERLMVGRLEAKDIMRASLAPALISAGATPQQANALVTMLAGLTFSENSSKNRAEIDRGINELVEWFESANLQAKTTLEIDRSKNAVTIGIGLDKWLVSADPGNGKKIKMVRKTPEFKNKIGELLYKVDVSRNGRTIGFDASAQSTAEDDVPLDPRKKVFAKTSAVEDKFYNEFSKMSELEIQDYLRNKMDSSSGDPLAAVTTQIEKVMDTDTNNKFALLEAFFRVLEANDGYLIGHYLGNIKANIEQMTDGPIVTRLYSLQDQEKIMEDLFKQRAFARRIFEIWETSLASQGRVKTDSSQSGFADPLLLMGLAGAALLFGALGFVGLGIISSALLHDIYYFYMQNGSLNGYGFAGLPRRVAKRFTVLLALARGKPEIISGEKVPGINAALLSLKLSPEKFNEMVRGKLVAGITALGQMKDRSHGIYVRMPVETAMGVLSDEDGFAAIREKFSNLKNPYIGVAECGGVSEMNYGYHNAIPDLLIPLQVAIVNEFLKPLGGMAVRSSGTRIYFVCPGNIRPEKMEAVRNGLREILARSIDDLLAYDEVTFDEAVVDPKNSEQVKAAVAGVSSVLAGQDKIAGVFQSRDGVFLLYEQKYRGDVLNALNLNKNGGAALRLVNKSGGSSNTGSIRNMVTDFTVVKAQGTDSLETAIVKAEIIQQSLPSGIVLPEGSRNEFTVDRDAVSNLDRIETEAVSRRIAANEGNDYIKRLVNNDGSGWFENGLVSGSRLNDVLASFLKYENPPQFFKAQMKFRITDNSIVGTKQSRAGWDDVKCTDYGYDKETDTFNYRIFRRLYGAFVSQKIIRALTSAIDSEVLKIKRNEVPLVSGTEYFSFIPTQEGFGGLTEKQFSVIADKSTNAIRNLLSGEIGLSGIEPEISMHVINAGDAGRFQLADVANRLSEAGESDDLFDEVKSPSGNIIRLFNVSKAGALMRNTERIRLVKRYLGRVAQLHRHMYLVRNKLRSSRESTERLQLNNELKDLELEEKDLKLELTGKINSRLEEEKASLKSEGIKDAMTGNLVEGKITYSKAHFENIVLRDAIGNAKRNNKNIFFSMFDGDNFKSINDKYGHEAGDIVIKAFAIVARKVLRSTDQLARFGGDEFAAIVESGDHDFDSSDAENRLTAAERLRKAFSDSDSVMLYAEIEKMDRALADKMRADKRTFSISVGVVRYDPQDKSLANMGVKEIASILKKRADVALYYAKEGKYVKDGEMHPSANGGRNNSLVWDPVMGDKTPEEKRREERGLLINEISKILPEGLVADVVSGVPEEVTRIQQKMSRYNFGVFYSGGKIWISSEADEKIVLGSAQLAKNTDKSLGFLKDKNDLNELLRDNIELYYITNTDILLISEKEPDEKSVFDSISGDEGLIGIGLLAEMSLVVIGIGLFLAGNPITAGFVGFAAAGLFVLEFVVSRGKKSAPARSSALSPEALRQRAVERAVLASGEKLPRARILGLVGDLASRTPSKKQAGVLGNEKGNTVLYLTGLTLTGVAIAIIAAGNYFTGGALAAVTLGAFAIFKGRNFLVARSENSANAKLLDQGINELAAEIKNSNPAVSLAAKKAVAGIFAARALKENIDIQQLADMLGDEAELGPVYAAMVNSGQMKIEDLKALPKNEKWQVRRAAVAALGIYYSDKDPRKVKFAVGEISDMLIDKNKEVRDSAGESFAALLATLVRNGRMETSALIATSREISGLSIIVSASMASDDTSGFKNAIADMKNYKEAVRKNSGLDSLLLGSGFESMNDDLAAVAFRAYGMHRALSLALAQLYAEQEAGGADINVGVAEKIVRDNGFNAANPVGLDALYAAMVARGRMTIDDLMAMRNSGKQLLIRDAGKALITVFADKASRGEISFNRETGEIGVPETLDKASLGPVYAAMALRGDISTEYLRELAQNSKTRAVALEALGVVYMDLASRVEKPGIIDRAISSQRTPGSFLSGFFTRRGITRGSPEVVSLTNGQKAELWRAKVWGNIEANLSQEDSEFQRTVRDNLKHAIDQIAENMANGEANPELVNLKVNEYDTIKPSVKGDRRVGAFALAGNPLHWGQLVTALEAMAQKKLDKVVFILQGPGDPDKPEMDVTLKERAEMGRELLKIFEGICEVSEVSYATQGRGEKTVFDLSEWNQGAVEGKGSLTFAYLVGSDHQHYWAPKVIEANKNNPEFFNQKIEDLIKADIADNPDAQKRGDGKRFNELDTIGKFDYNLTQYAQDLKKRGHAMEVHFNVRPGFESEYMDQEKTRIEEVGSKFQFASFVGQRFEASSTAIRNWITGKASPEAEIILPKTIKRMIESEAYKQYRAVLFMLAYIKDKGKANPELKKVPLVEMAHRKMMLDSIGKEITPENLLAAETTSKVINNQKGYISLKFSVGILSATIGVLIGLLLGVQYGAITFLISYLTILSFRKALDMSIKVLFNKKYDKNPADNYNEISDEERALIVELNWLKDRIARVEPIIKRVEIEEGDFEPIWWTHLEIKKVVEESNPEYWSLRNEITRVEQLLNSEREKRKQNIKAGATSTLKSIFLAAALSATMLVVGFTNAQAGQNMASGMPMPVTASSVQLETRSAVSAIADAYRQSEELPAPIIGMQTSKIREELSSLLENCRNDVIKTKISSDGKFSERRVTGRIKNVNAVVEKLYEEMRVSGHLDTYMLQMDPEIAKALVLYSIADPVDYQAWKNQNITIEMKANLGGMASTGGDEFGGFYGNPSVFIRKDNNINPFMLFTMMLHEFSHVEESAANFIEFNWKYNLYQAALDFVSDVRPEEKRAFTRMYDKLKTQFGIEVTNADDAQMNAQRSMLYNKWPFVLIGIFNSISFQLLPMFLLFKAASFIFRGGKKNSGKNINQARRLQGSPRARVTTPEPEYEAAVKQVEREISENGSVTKLPATKSSKQTLRKMMLSIVFSAALSVTVFMAGFASAQTRLWNNIPVGDFAGVDASLDKEIAYYLDTIAAQYEENDLNQVQRIKTGNILPGDFEALNKKLNEETANYLKVKAAEYERNIVEPKVVESETWDSATIIGNSIAAIIFAILTHRFFLRLYWASVRTYYSIYYWNYDRKIINGLEKPKLGKKYTFEAWGYTPGLLLLFSQMIERAPDLAVPTGRFRVWQETIVTFEEFAKNNGGLVLLRGHGGWRDFSGEYTLIFGNRTHLKFTVENEHNVRVKCTVYLHKDLHNKTLNDFGTDLRRKFNLANSGYSRKWWRGRYFDPLIIVALSSILSVPGLAYASANASDTKVFTIAGLLAVSVGAVAELASRIKSKKLETVVDNSKPEPQPTDPLDAAQKMVQNAVSPKDAAGLITNSIAGDKSWVAKNIPQIAGKNNILVYMPENMSNAQTLAAERSKLGIQTISIGLLTGQVKNDVPLDFLGLFPIRIKDGYMSVQVYFFKSQSGLELYVAPADKAYAHSGVAVGNMAMAIVNELNDNKAATIQSKAMLSSALVAIVNELKDGYLKDRFKGLGFGGEAWQIELDSDKEMLATLDSLIVDSSMRRRVLLSFWADQNAETPDYFKEKANSYSALNEAALKERKEKKDSKDASFTNIGFNTAIESLRGETEMLLGNTANIEPLAKNLQDSGVSRIVLMAGLNLSGITDLVPEIKLLVKDYKLDPAAADRLINGLKDMNISDNVINAETAGGFRNAAGGVAREALKLKFNGSDSALKDSLNANGRGYYELLMNIAMENWLALNPGKGSENREAVLSKYSKEIMFEAYLAGLFIGQLKIAAKNSREKYGIDVMLDLGKVDAAFMVSAVEKAGALLENGVVSGLQFSISGYANNEEKELFLSALKNRIDNGVRMGLIDRNVPIIIRSGREDISLVKKYGFEAGVDVKAKTAAELDPDLVSDGASLYVRPGAEKSSVGLLEKVLGLGAAGVMIELGGVDANGNVIKLPMKVEASGMLAFNDLLGLLDNIPFVEVMTPEAREFAGERSGKIAYSAITAKTAPEEKQKLLEGLYARKAEGYTAMRDILGLLVSVPESSNPSELDAFSGMVSSKLKSSGLPESVKSAVNDSLSEIGKKVKSAKDLKAKQIYAWEIVGFVYGFAGSLLVDTSPSRINKSEVRLPEVSRLMVRASESLEFDKDGRAGISGDRVDVKIGQLAGILALAGEKQKIAIINSIASEIGKAGVNNASLWVELGEIIQLIDNAAIDKELKNNGIENRIIEARRIAQPNRDSAANKLVNEIEKLRNSLINADAYEARMDGLANIVLRDYAGALSTSAGFEDKKALSVALEITIKRLMLKTFELSADELKKSVEEGASEAFRRNLRAVLSAA
ncbi:MAG TPA: hypothetical protein DEE98_05015 [Elusimicrobia bacterium]|nr:MAG: hypothetical protein A2278_04690 [Elusimicrobia bacterium RIFOXYA12_FULL_49_49]OGS14656.1 MAG: hypothetical protein A2251_09150 [Elusimicrobia bacterium RIFOXYA2_FULL_47_53]OGS31747.1 MAG: hypothetical protein A2323_06060 [Elusimicrobia bacterium RIFOXYB2_FULL_46_23]HBU69725.1 hypothetical protein [Elusimicrobiota bacterium]